MFVGRGAAFVGPYTAPVRAAGVVYQNTKPGPRYVTMTAGASTATIAIDPFSPPTTALPTILATMPLDAVVPPGYYYSVTAAAAPNGWVETN